jgi:ubiquitin-conjugating enzyme E2 J1
MTSIYANKSVHVKATNCKRLMSFMKELEKNPSDYYEAKPSYDDITIWYVKIKNLSEEYTGGIYYMKIHFTEEYPFKAPDYYMLTPSGRFEINKKICFSNSGYHSESWSPLWGINQIIMGTISFFYERNSVGICHISNGTNEERIRFALASAAYNKTHLAKLEQMFPEIVKVLPDIEVAVAEPEVAEPEVAEPVVAVAKPVVAVAKPVVVEPVVVEPVVDEPKVKKVIKKLVKKSEQGFDTPNTVEPIKEPIIEPEKKVVKKKVAAKTAEPIIEPEKKVVKKKVINVVANTVK